MTEIQKYIAELPVSRLPAKVREYIKQLEKRLEDDTNLLEIRRLLQQATGMQKSYKKLQTRCDIMTELLTCASRGGHETAQAYVQWAIAEYGEEDLGSQERLEDTTA